MTLEELRGRGRAGRDRHRAARAHRHAGPPAGQAPDRAPLPRRGRRARRRGLQLPARRRRRHGARRGLRDVLLGARLRRLRAAPRPRHAAAGALAGGRPSMCLADVAWQDGSDVRVSPRQILRRQLARLAERGWSANAGTELEFIVFRDTYEQAWQKGYRELEPGQPLQRRLLAARHRARRAADPPHPQQHGGRRDARARTPRASATSASTRSTSTTPTRCGPPTSTRSTRTAPRRSPRSRAWRSRSWPSTTSARATRATSTSRSPTTKGPLFDRDRAAVRVVPRRPARRAARADAAARAEHQLLQALRRRELRADGGRLGPRQPHLRAARRRPRARRCASRTASGGADLNPYMALSAIIAAGLHGVEQGLELEPVFEGNAYAAHETPARPATRCAEARELFAGQRDRARGVRRGGRRRTTSTPPTSSSTAFGAAVTDWERYRGFERL